MLATLADASLTQPGLVYEPKYDGILALVARGRPAGFQQLQGRIHVKGSRDVERLDAAQPAALIVFDILRDGDEDVRGLPLTDRRARLEARLGAAPSDRPRLSEQVPGEPP